jgi:hypothetical protein
MLSLIRMKTQNYFLMLFRRHNCNISLIRYIQVSETLLNMNLLFCEYWLVVKALNFYGGRDKMGGIEPRWGLECPELHHRWRQVILSIPVRTGHGTHPASHIMVIGAVSCGGGGGQSSQCVAMTTLPHLEPRLKLDRAISAFPLCLDWHFAG